MVESNEVWQEVDEDVVVVIAIIHGKHKLRNEIKISFKDLRPVIGMKSHMLLARHMEDYFYTMAQNFCDRVLPHPTKLK